MTRKFRFLIRKLAHPIRLFAVGLAILMGVLAVGSVLSALAIEMMNAEYFTRTRDLITLKPSRDVSESVGDYPLVLRLRLVEFDESTGRLDVQLFAYTRDNDYRQQLETGRKRIFVSITDGMSTNSITNLERARLMFVADTIPNVSYFVSQSNTLEMKPIFLSDVSIFPFDTYRARLLIWVISPDGLPPPFALEVEKSYFVRTLSVEGTPNEVEIAASRPILDKVVVVGSAGLFLLICVLVSVSLMIERRHLTGLEESLALAGFLLAAIGFREFAGFTELKSRSFLDVVVFLVPLAALFVVFVSRFVIGLQHNLRKEKPSTPESESNEHVSGSDSRECSPEPSP
jgi:hypothetical protein